MLENQKTAIGGG